MKHIACHEFEFEAYCCHAPSHLLLLSLSLSLCVCVSSLGLCPAVAKAIGVAAVSLGALTVNV